MILIKDKWHSTHYTENKFILRSTSFYGLTVVYVLCIYNRNHKKRFAPVVSM